MSTAPYTPQVLAREARSLLERNSLGTATRPGPHLYPHQWSWDAAFIAIGLARVDPLRACAELRALMRGQWSNGMVPHIVFHPEAGAYFPGPEEWQTTRSPAACATPRTSGIVQPPIHATAAWHIHLHGGDPSVSLPFLREIYPALAAWHQYLHRDRDPLGTGLVAIRHPWESGQDDSPAWDRALAAIPLREGTRTYRRVDLTMVKEHERPTDDDYDHYIQLVECFRLHDYDERAMRGACPFLVEDPLFNALLVQGEADLAAIAEVIGEDPQPARARAARTAAALEAHLWSEADGCYLAYDRGHDRPLPPQVASGLTPLYAGVPSPARAQRLLALLESPRFWPVAGEGFPLTSSSRLAGDFDPWRYWRGPVWVNVNWLMWRGLRRFGFDETARALRAQTLELVARTGFFEYYHPETGQGLGSDEFSWTAALVIDLLAEGDDG